MTDRWRRPNGHEDDRLSAFLDDELTEDEALAVARHLHRCDVCLGELEGLRATRATLRGLPNVAPPAAVLDRAAARAASDGRRRRRAALQIGSGGLAAAALLAAAGFLAGADRGTVVPPVEMFVVDHVARTGGGPVLTPVDLRTGR